MEKLNDLNYKAAINETVDVIIITDGTTRKIVDVNKSCCHLLGYDKSDLIGNHLSVLFDNESTQTELKVPGDICMYGSVLPNRNLRSKHGELIPVDMTINTLEGEWRSYVMTSFRDTRERLCYENKILSINKELQESNASKDKLFSIIAHDLKNPLMALMGLSEIISEDSGEISPEESIELANTINKLSKDTYDLLDNLLNWANIQTKKISVDKKLINFYIIASKILDTLKPSADLKKINLVNNANKDFSIYADENMIKTILRNLISNSIKFSKADSNITISTMYNDNTKSITVEDEGVGMEESYISNLFKTNVQTSRYGTNNEKGTGLGLLLCYEFVKLHNGDIDIKSQLGKGSKFIIRLPE
jgi:PAS domain S-box-containing protein